MNFVLQRSPGGTHVRNLGGTKNRPPGNAFSQLVLAVVPVCGFGKFSPASKFNSLSWWNPISLGGADYTGLVFTDEWPNVFLQLDESITSAGPAGTSTRRTVYSQCTDTFLTQTLDDGAGQFNLNGWQSPDDAAVVVSPDGTTLSITWMANGAPVSYVAAVSHQLNAFTSWGGWTGQALTMLGEFAFPAWNDPTLQEFPLGCPLPGTCAGWFLWPISTPPCVALPPNSLSGPWSALVMAAANGAAVRISTAFATLQGWASAPSNTVTAAYIPDTPVANAWEQDEPAPASLVGTAVVPNAGCVLCARSRWQLLGLPPNYPTLTDNNTNHLAGLWGQPMEVPVGGAPYFVNYFPQYYGATRAPRLMQFSPVDVTNALAGTGLLTPYGILGFRTPPPASGGAGGTSPGAGGGAPPI